MLQGANAEHFVTTFLGEVILRFGDPRALVRDNDPQFIANFTQKLTLFLGIDQALTLVYPHEANMVEQKNS